MSRARKGRAIKAQAHTKAINRAASRPMKSQVKPPVKSAKPSNIVKRQSSRAHALEIAGAVERRLTEVAEKKVPPLGNHTASDLIR